MTVKNITVLGSGVMGHGIAQVSATAGYNVVLRDIKQEFLDKAMEKIKWSLDKLVSKEKISKEEGDSIFSRITPIVDLNEAVKNAELVIEVVPEIMDLKKSVYAELDKAASPEVVFASNTSTLPITEIANTTSRPEKFIGIHFFNPPQLMKLVEVIPGEKTSQEITDLTQEYVKSVNKQAVLCRKDVPGFIINRLFIPMVHEACYAQDRTNAALEEIVMAIRTRNDLMPFTTGIKTELLSKASKVVSNATFPVQFNKAIVGKNAFAHEAGIHQDGMLKNRETYEIMTPESVGVKKTSLVMGKHSGRHAFKEKLNDLGYADVTDDVIQSAFGKFKVLADKKKHVYDDDIMALVDDSLISDNKINAINLKSLKVFAGTGEPQKAEMTLDVYGEVKSTSETGDGPVDAIFKCIKVLYPHDVKLQLYQVHAVTEGTDAQATVSVRIEEEGKTTVGQAADTDTLVASANAYLSALNKMIIKRKKTAPMEHETQKVKGI